MTHDTRRITLISRNPRTSDRPYNTSLTAQRRLVVVDSFPLLRNAVVNGSGGLQVDLERIILDRNASSADYLFLLSHLPHDFHGDVLYVREDDSAFLSSSGRGGDRLVYALSPVDLQFYFETHDLLSSASGMYTASPVAIFERAAYRAVGYAS